MTQLTIAVANAQPAAPMAVTPKCPNVNIHVSGNFSASPRRLSDIITRGRDTAVV